MSEGLLARLRGQKPASPSAINLVTQQRFGLATSVANASAYLLMSPVAATNPDTGERAAPGDAAVMPSDEGARWLDRTLSVADLRAVARALPAPSPWRTRIARRDAERARLLKMHSATGFVGLHAIAWAESHPADKEAPWLLYVAIQSSKGAASTPTARPSPRRPGRCCTSAFRAVRGRSNRPVSTDAAASRDMLRRNTAALLHPGTAATWRGATSCARRVTGRRCLR